MKFHKRRDLKQLQKTPRYKHSPSTLMPTIGNHVTRRILNSFTILNDVGYQADDLLLTQCAIHPRPKNYQLNQYLKMKTYATHKLNQPKEIAFFRGHLLGLA